MPKTILEKAATRLSVRLIDLPLFVCLLKGCLLVFTTLAFLIFPAYSLYIFPIHVLIFMNIVGPFITMFHDANHHPLFKNHFLNKYFLGGIGLLYGMTPNTYFCHHIVMHHPEDNGHGDLSTTRPFRRDSFRDFMVYYFRFISCIYSLSVYLRASGKKHKTKMANKMLFTEVLYFAIAFTWMFFNPLASLAVLIIPPLVTRSFLIIGNWGEHAFINPHDPHNPYTSTTNILGTYNDGWFNVGFHIGHHIKPNLHFSLLEQDFYDNIDKYAKADAIVFEGVHFPHIWFYLMTKNYEKLASLFVQLPGQAKRSEAEIIELLKTRVVPIPAEQLNAA